MSVGVREGEIIAGKYRVERLLGAGAMGAVVAATHLRLDRKVAIKLMLASSLGQPELVARFAREARAAAKIASEHVARVLDVGELEGGVPYIVMEYLEGEDLGALLARRGLLPVPEAVGYVLETCEAMAEAHRAGIVHRDLKPENLFLAARPDGSRLIKVLDFGISKTANEEAANAGLSLTRATTVLGSPLYMPPEQLYASRDVDPRSDIWSLGVILHELLAGQPPFRGRDLDELIADVTTNDAPAVGRDDVPPSLEAAIARCLCREREGRFDDLAALARAIAPFGPPGSREAAERIKRVLRGSLPPPPGTPLPSILPLSMTTAMPTPRSLLKLARSTESGVARRRAKGARLMFVGAAVTALSLGGAVGLLKRLPGRSPSPASGALSPALPPAPSALPPAPSPAAPAASASTAAPVAAPDSSAGPAVAPPDPPAGSAAASAPLPRKPAPAVASTSAPRPPQAPPTPPQKPVDAPPSTSFDMRIK